MTISSKTDHINDIDTKPTVKRVGLAHAQFVIGAVALSMGGVSALVALVTGIQIGVRAVWGTSLMGMILAGFMAIIYVVLFAIKERRQQHAELMVEQRMVAQITGDILMDLRDEQG